MNSKLGTAVSTFLIVVGAMIWSVTVLASLTDLADETRTVPTDTTAQAKSRSAAADANRGAAQDVAARLREITRLDLDIELLGRTSVQVAGN